MNTQVIEALTNLWILAGEEFSKAIPFLSRKEKKSAKMKKEIREMNTKGRIDIKNKS